MSAECTWVKGHLAPLIDKELSSEDRARAERHLASCAACRAALERLKELDQIDREALWRSEFQEAGARKTDPDAPQGVKPGSSRDDEDPTDALMRAVRSRFDLESAKRLRRRELEELDGTHRSDREAARVAKRDAKGGATPESERAAKRDAERDATLDTARGVRAAARYLSGEDVADLPLEESLHRRRADGTAHERAADAAPVGHADRGGRETQAARKQDAASAQPRKSWLQRFADLWPKPSSPAVWLPLAGGTAAVAVLVMLLTARDADRAREAIHGSVRGDVPTELDVSEGARRSPEILMEDHAGRGDASHGNAAHDDVGSGGGDDEADGSVDVAMAPGSGEKAVPKQSSQAAEEPEPEPATKETQSPAAPTPATPSREEWSRDAAVPEAPAADKPGWHQALGNLLRILDRPESSGANLAEVRLEEELLEAEQVLAQRMTEAGAELWQAPGSDRRTHHASSDRLPPPPTDEPRMMTSADGSGAASSSARGRARSRARTQSGAEGPAHGLMPEPSEQERSIGGGHPDGREADGVTLPAVIQSVVDGTALPQTEDDTQAYWAVAEGWYALWREDPESHDRASHPAHAAYAAHAARYYGALRLAILENGLPVTNERDVLLSERLRELETALGNADGAPWRPLLLPVHE